jgi:adenylate cyclase class 2
MLATVVTVPELDGTFVELETIASGDELSEALGAVRGVPGELGISDADPTTEQYTTRYSTPVCEPGPRARAGPFA